MAREPISMLRLRCIDSFPRRSPAPTPPWPPSPVRANRRLRLPAPDNGASTGLFPADSLFQQHGHGLTHLFPNRIPYLGLDGQLMRAVSHCHERALKGIAINFPGDFHQTTGSKKNDRLRPDNVGPTALFGTLLQFGGKRLAQHVRMA